MARTSSAGGSTAQQCCRKGSRSGCCPGTGGASSGLQGHVAVVMEEMRRWKKVFTPLYMSHNHYMATRSSLLKEKGETAKLTQRTCAAARTPGGAATAAALPPGS